MNFQASIKELTESKICISYYDLLYENNTIDKGIKIFSISQKLLNKTVESIISALWVV